MRPAAFALLALIVPNRLTHDGLAQHGLAQSGNAAVAQITLALPHPLGAGEMAWIEVQVGPIGRRQISVTTVSGQALGTISPFGARPGQDAGTFTLPVPADAIRDGHVAIRLAISQPGAPPRAPTAQELRGVRLTVGGAAR